MISGKYEGIVGPAKNFVPVLSLQSTIKEAGKKFTAQIPSNYNGFIYVMSGQAKFGGSQQSAKTGEVLILPPSNPKAEDDSLDTFEAISESPNVHFILFAGKPLNEPVFARGPFVMDSQQGLADAYRDIQRGEKYFIH